MHSLLFSYNHMMYLQIVRKDLLSMGVYHQTYVRVPESTL